MEIHWKNIPDTIDLGRWNNCIDWKKGIKEISTGQESPQNSEEESKSEEVKPLENKALSIYDCLS